MHEHMKFMGHKVRDAVTGFTGTVSSICFDLYGCVQAGVSPDVGKDGKLEDARWFDTKRLSVVSKKPVMEVPDFSTPPGPERKSPLPSSPLR
jgi:hypothetical protein